MTVLTEKTGNMPTIQGKIMTVLTEAPGNLPTIQGRIMPLLTEVPGNLPTIQWQYNDSYDRSIISLSYYSMVR